MKKRFKFKWLWLILLSFLALAGWFAYYAVMPLKLQPSSQEISIRPNSSLRSIARQLVVQGVLKDSWRFIILAKMMDKEAMLQSGNYTLNKNVSPYQLLLSLNNGKPTQGSITFIEGHNFAKMRVKLSANPAIKHTIEKLSDTEIMQALSVEFQKPEGLFFPDTFYFNRGTTDLEILKRSYTQMQSKLAKAWEYRADDLPYKSPYEALIMASIIEKETGKASERPMIAGVFINRLKIGMRLQTDPTVIYGMGLNYDGNIRKKDLLTDTPYNTYTRDGLPPTPIAMPGLASIDAALHPEATKALYFVGKGDGSHYFSNNLNEHLQAVTRYQLKK